jgi:SAM-dependent methyltransferase
LKRLGSTLRAIARSARRSILRTGDSRSNWDRKWAREDFAPPWLGRGVAKEVVAAVEDGWFPAGARVLDIGCGQGEIAAWVAGRGFPALGIDIAPAAIERARKLHSSIAALDFQVVDICTAAPSGTFGVLIDRGCLHQIQPALRALYARNVAGVCETGTRFILLMRAFRNGVKFGDAAERDRIMSDITKVLGHWFTIDRAESTHLGDGDDQSLPGMAFWMTRR